MKRLSSVLFAMLLTAALHAQPMASIEINSKGFGLQGSYKGVIPIIRKFIKKVIVHGDTTPKIWDDIELTAGFNEPFRSAENPSLYYLTAGYMYRLSEMDPVIISFNAGAAYSIRKDFKRYDSENGPIETIRRIKPMGRIEIGKQMNDGIFYVHCSHAGVWWYGVGCRFIF